MFKSKTNKIIGLATSFFLIISLISIKKINANANDISSKPSFEISNLKATPDTAIIREDILISGQLIPKDFEKSVQSKEIVLVLDTSNSMSDEIVDNDIRSTKIESLKNAAIEFIEKLEGTDNLKIGIITYGSIANINKVNIGGRTSSLIPIENSDKMKEIINTISSGGGTNIGEGLRQALYLLNNSKESDKNADKTIVLMSDALSTYCTVLSKNPVKYYLDTTKEIGGNTWNSGSGANDLFGYDLNYSKEIASLIKNTNINVFTIGYGLDDDGLKKLKEIHSSMLGLESEDDCNEENGFYSKNNGSIDYIFNEVGEEIKESYLLKDSSLDLNIASDFTLNIDGKNIKIGDIHYTKKSTDEEVNSTKKILYGAEPIDFSFTVKGNKVGDNQQVLDRIDINFNFENKNIKESHSVDVRVNIIEENNEIISHGLYNGISNGEINIEENNNEFLLLPDSTVTFGSEMIIRGDKANINLYIDSNLLANNKEIKIYKIDNNKNIEVKNASIINNGINNYTISIDGFKSEGVDDTKILVVYKGTIKNNEKKEMKNIIAIKNLSKEVNITTKSSLEENIKLPDLF